MTDEKKCSRHGHDISKSLCPLCAVEAKEGAVANAEADRDHWKKEAEGWRVQFTNAANVADKLKEQLDETKLFSGDIEGALRRAVEEANRTGQAMGAARAAARISEVEDERDQALLNANKCLTYDRETIATLKSRLEDCYQANKHAKARTVEPRDTEPPRREAVVGKPYPSVKSSPVQRALVSIRAAGLVGDADVVEHAMGHQECYAVTRKAHINRAKEGTPAPEPAGLSDPEPAPTGDGEPIWPLVIADMEERNREGVRKYGTPLRAHNGRKALVDLYQELLDAVAYCRQHIEEGSDGA